MGSLTSNFCGVDVNTEQYMDRIESMIKLAGRDNEECELLQIHRDRLVSLINAAQPAKEQLGRYQVELQLIPARPSAPNSPSSAPQRQVKLILRTEVDQSIRPCETEEGLHGYIILPDACYYGQIRSRQAHGQGTVYCSGYQIVGEWHHDSFRSGKIIKHVPQLHGSTTTIVRTDLCHLELRKGEREAILITEDFSYHGSVTLKDANSISQMLTGEGRILYRNGDSYQGGLVNGVFETSLEKKAVFKCAQADGQFTFEGSYRNGLKEGRGKLDVDCEGRSFSFYVNFSSGVPVETGLMNSPYTNSFSIDVVDGRLVVDSRMCSPPPAP